jgi:hypothetical protein
MVNLFPSAFARALNSDRPIETEFTPTRKDKQTRVATASTTVRTPEVNSSVEVGGSDPPTEKKLKGYKRPEVSGLLCCKRLDKPPSDYTEALRKEDNTLLSAALAACSRAKRVGASTEVVTETLLNSRYSKESFHRLWPSLRYRRQYAVKRAGKLGKDKPEVRRVEDKYIVYTPNRPAEGFDATDEFNEDEDVYKNRLLPLEFVPFHSNVGMETSLCKDLVQDFINSKIGNYTSLAPYIHCVEGRLALYWLNFGLTSLKWETEDDSDLEITITDAPSPKKKKRRRSDGTDG